MSDVKGWSPEYQSILETFDMINNKYENPDVSKDLNISYINSWNSTTNALDIYGPLNWNSYLHNNLVYPFWSEVYINNNRFFNNISIFLHIYNNEKRDRMHVIFQVPKMTNFNETENPKRMEMGYYCKDKKEFKTLFNNQSFTNGKHIRVNNLPYYIIYGNKCEGGLNEPKTVGNLLTFLKAKVNSSYDSYLQVLVYRHFKTVKNYLSGIDSQYSVKFIPSLNNDYSGGGVLSSFSLTYNERLINFNRVLQTNSFLNKFKPGGYYTNAYNNFDDKNKEFTNRILRGELVTSTEMNEIINIPHTLSDGTESYWTFAECFADHCGWYTSDNIIPLNSVISDVTWSITLGFPSYITMNDNYLC